MNGFLKFIPYNQFQDLLLPVNVQDCVPENHVARMVSLIIDFIDMSAIIVIRLWGCTYVPSTDDVKGGDICIHDWDQEQS